MNHAQSHAALAKRQHGVVSRSQLAALGLGRRAIGHRLECERLHLIQCGVFAVGHRALSREAQWLAAVLAVGPGAVLSHRSAAALWGIRETARGQVDVTVSRKLRSRVAIQMHKARLAADERTVQTGIPVTTPARTLLDLATVLTPQTLERAIDKAEVLRLTSQTPLAALAARHRGRPGTPAMNRILDAGFACPTITRSELEDRFLAFLDDAVLPRPNVNTVIEGLEVDFAWQEQSSSSSSTATRPTAPAPRSRATAPATGSCRWPAGASSASPGGSCTSGPPPWPRS